MALAGESAEGLPWSLNKFVTLTKTLLSPKAPGSDMLWVVVYASLDKLAVEAIIGPSGASGEWSGS